MSEILTKKKNPICLAWGLLDPRLIGAKGWKLVNCYAMMIYIDQYGAQATTRTIGSELIESTE